ncbi:MAG: DUF2812 domain-containing protein [Halanaerobiales bacterium]
MSQKIKRVFKVFWAWQEEEEGRWLREMGQKGWLLEKYNIFSYTFIKSEPGDYIYKMDYRNSLNFDKYEYVSFFADAGWEHVTQFLGWHYFRTKADECIYPDIYSDNSSRIQKYKSFLRVLIIIAVANGINFVNALTGFHGRASILGFNFLSILRILVILVLGLLLYAIYRTRKTIKELEDEL